MKAILKHVVLSSLLTLAVGTPLTTQADEEAPKPTTPTTPAVTTPPAAKKPVRQTMAGRVVSIDRAHRTVTVQVNNLTYVLEIADSTRLSRNGVEQTMADFVVGDEVTVNVILRELPDGRVEVAVLEVQLPERTDAQGPGKSKGKGPPFIPPPFQNGPNPGNVDGPFVSPSR